ncbi:MAG: 2-hydroxyacyl-CoA dehydratase [Candidatus Methanoliparum thermophilum]|uniref:2-hydroxyacyl-CoA dehydratase n=1 Tax=Methanoliparum thermophilum TaxID=2491083 RepID=A0A520KTN6_METT2|nr:MAG: 2-hydroxyacyl-CoA dehydratase [Candidatus Methanoliparum thermophilum]
MIEEFYDSGRIREYIQRGKRIIGTFCSYTPEEIIHAAGLVPVRLFGETVDIMNAYSYIPNWLCYYSKRTFEEGLIGNYDFLDGFVFLTSDDTNQLMYSIWKKNIKVEYSYMLQFPFSVDGTSKNFFTKVLEKFKRSLEDHYSVDITDKDLKDSIEVYNRYRSLLKELYKYRFYTPPKISGSDVLKINLAGYSMLKEEFNDKIEEYINKLSDEEGLPDKPRLYVTGIPIYDPLVFEMIESCGFTIVFDDLCNGSRNFDFEINETISNPIEAIAEGYLLKPTCGTCSRQKSLAIDERLSYINERLKTLNPDGIVIIGDKGCELCAFSQVELRKELAKIKPVLYLEIDFPLAKEQHRTRIEAFLESLS